MITANKQVIQPASCVLTVRHCEAGCDEFVVCWVASNTLLLILFRSIWVHLTFVYSSLWFDEGCPL